MALINKQDALAALKKDREKIEVLGERFVRGFDYAVEFIERFEEPGFQIVEGTELTPIQKEALESLLN